MTHSRITQATKSGLRTAPASASPSPHPLNAMLALQGSAGNQAVLQMLGRSARPDQRRAGHEASAELRSPGKPLDAATRELMESRFHEDFSAVRIHSEGSAARSAGQRGAQAYTAGDHIVFDSSRFSPETPEGLQLLAHELAHVVQQRKRSGASAGTRETERGARDASEAIARGRDASVTQQAPAGEVQMQPAPGASTAQAAPETDEDKQWQEVLKQAEEHPIVMEGHPSHEFDELFAASKALGYLLPIDTSEQFETRIRNRIQYSNSTEYADSWSAEERWDYAEASPEEQEQMDDAKWRSFVDQNYMAYLRDQKARWDKATRQMSALANLGKGIGVVAMAPAVIFGGGELLGGASALTESAGTLMVQTAPRAALWLTQNPLLATTLAGSALSIAESGQGLTKENVLWSILAAFAGHAGDVSMQSAPEPAPDVSVEPPSEPATEPGPAPVGGLAPGPAAKAVPQSATTPAPQPAVNAGPSFPRLGGPYLNRWLMSAMLGFRNANVTQAIGAGGLSTDEVAAEVATAPGPAPAVANSRIPSDPAAPVAPDVAPAAQQVVPAALQPASQFGGPANVPGSTDPNFWASLSAAPSGIRTGTAEDRSISDLVEYAKRKVEAVAASVAAQPQQQPAALAQTGTGGPVVGPPTIAASANRGGGSGAVKPGFVSTAPTTRTRQSATASRSGGSKSAQPAASKAKAILRSKYVKAFGLSKQETRIVERASELYVHEMATRKAMPAQAASTEAHRAAQDQLTSQFKNVVVEEPTGITGPKLPRNEANLRSSDVQINREPGSKTNLNANIAGVMDFKRTAFLNEKGVLIVNPSDPQAEVEKDQIQSYEVGFRELGIPAFIVNRYGEIFAPNPNASEGWIKVGDVE